MILVHKYYYSCIIVGSGGGGGIFHFFGFERTNMNFEVIFLEENEGNIIHYLKTINIFFHFVDPSFYYTP